MIKNAILETLAMCRRAGRTMTRRALKLECENQTMGRNCIGDGEFDAALNDLESKRFVSYEINALTGDRQYSITDTGLKLLD